MTYPTDALSLVPGKRLRPDSRVQPGDVLRVVETFTNPDLLTKGDVVIVQSQGDDGNIVALNLFRNTAQYGFNPTRYAFVHRPATRMKADYSHMSAAAPASPLPEGGGPHERWSILNHLGGIWTPENFDTERQAVAYLDRWKRDNPKMDLSRHKVVPVLVAITAAPTGDARNGKGEG